MAETGTSSQVGLSVSMSPSQSVIVSTTGADLHLPLSDLSLGSSLSSVSSHLNPPAPPVVVPVLVTAPPSKATKKGKRVQAKTTKGGIGVAPARATRSTNRQKKP
ncbi:hypothetical protein PISMIDRAFT_17138 [Pisolithus microcarpus 441]|uniref:Uncharacterized protein n=1 Tax=Pisolithus microcarpus 441 TaxID=765257 RepID=A0A0C9Z3P4_9AGAM|nr:hypothetical protein PISMIDRAFT_17138 [Pisolithus microcarpus 441]